MPQRIQRKRTKGWRKPKNAFYVGRPTKYGNPFRFMRDECGEPFRVRAGYAVTMYELWARGELIDLLRVLFTPTPPPSPPWTLEELRAELGGKDLCCWCRLDRPCHADILLELANEGE